MIVRIEDIALVAAPGAIGTEEFVERAPSLLVFGGRFRSAGGVCNDLAPEKAVEVVSWRAVIGSGDHAVGDIEIGKAVVIEIPGVAGPSPAAHFDSGRSGD